MKKWVVMAGIICLPVVLFAQNNISDGDGLRAILDQLYADMIPLCQQLTGVGRCIAGFACVWYIEARVWRHIANAEPVDFFPLFRPFVLGFCIMIFPSVINLINGILHPTVTGTAAMIKNTNAAFEKHLQLKSDADMSQPLGMLNPSNWFRELFKQLLEILYEAVALCIEAIRVFYLIVLSILGPIVFGLSVFDGFQHTVTVWLAKYINVYLWLPVANIFAAIIAKIQDNMLLADSNSIAMPIGGGFSMTDTAYLIFLLIAIAGYFTVPSVANYIVNAGGGNGLLHKVSSLTSKGAGMAASAGSGMASDAFGSGAMRMSGSMSDNANNHYFKDKVGGK